MRQTGFPPWNKEEREDEEKGGKKPTNISASAVAATGGNLSLIDRKFLRAGTCARFFSAPNWLELDGLGDDS